MNNFRVWKSAITRVVKAKNKLGFVDGTVIKVENDPIKSLKWEEPMTSCVLGYLGPSQRPFMQDMLAQERLLKFGMS